MKTVFLRAGALLGSSLPPFLLALVLVGCDSAGGKQSDAGRIVLGERVDGIPLGADTSLVRSALGVPTTIERGAGHVIYRYAHGDHAGFTIHFGMDLRSRPDGTTSFALASPYRGKTREGIGIGSHRTRVVDALGDPDFSNAGTSGLIHERYAAEDAQTGFLYDADERVLSITMNGPL